MIHPLVDFHCHVDLFDNMAEIIEDAERARVYTLAVTTTPRAWERNRMLTAKCRYVRAALGLHPQLVSERAGELPLWREQLSETKYVGEVGLDAGPRFYRSLDRQIAVFGSILDTCAEAGGKVISIHSVRSAGKVLEMLERRLPPNRGTAVLHWFTGSKAEAVRAVQLGCYFSVNAQMLKSVRGQAILAAIPRERVLTETDGPFTMHGDRPSRPSDISIAIASLSEHWNIDRDSVANTIVANLRAVIGDQMPQKMHESLPV